ncbi:hypothetical protein [Streptomyces sp. WG-D5]
MGAASVAVVCVSAGAVVALGGDDGPGSYVAVGAAGAAPTGPGDRVAPTGKVELAPLDPRTPRGPGAPDGSGKGSPAGGAGGSGAGKGSGGGQSVGRDVPAAGETPEASRSGSGGSTASANAKPPKSTSPGTGAGGEGPSAPSPAGPAKLALVGDPALAKADKRWCQDVTLTLHNSGGSAVRSGTVTFETHVIGALGIDWATVDVTKKLPVPIGAGERKRKTWNVCVDEWRVPLGMRLETKDVDVDWK